MNLAASSANLTSPEAPTIQIMGDNGRVLLTLDRARGRLVARYDPADLDEAAQRFVKAVESVA